MNNIPHELKVRRQFVVWGRDTKNPKRPHGYSNGVFLAKDWQNPQNWMTFDEAMAFVAFGQAQGVGFAFNGSGIYGVDLDRVFIGGELIPEAQEIVDRLNSYTEWSMSGNGLHIFVYAPGLDLLGGLGKGKTEYIFPGYDPVIDEKGKKNRRKVEYYQSTGYFAMTGKPYAEGGSAI